MGWSGGADLLASVLQITLPLMPRNARQSVTDRLIECFEDEDCDTIHEIADEFPEVRKNIDERFPPVLEDE